MTEATAQTFDTAEFERALAVLESEQQAMRLSPRQRRALRLYSAFIGGFIVFLPGAFLVYGLDKGSKSATAGVLIGLLFIAAILCLGGAVVSLLFNINLFLKIIRSRIHFRRLGLADGSEALWKAHQKKRWWSAGVEMIALVLSIFFLLITVLLFAYKEWHWGLGALSVGTVFLMFYVLQNGKARMDMMSARLAELTRLKESMAHLANSAGEAGGGRIAVPNDIVQQYSRVETEQIARSRAQAITDSMQAKTGEFSILSSQQVRQAKAGLAPADRLKIETALDALMREPRPAAAEQDPGTGMFRLPVSGTGLEVVYSADDSSMRLKVVALESPAVGSESRA